MPASLVVEGIQYATGVGIALGIALSSLPILSGEAREANERRYLQPTEEEEANSIRWGVMSVLSFIPYLSPLAWVFAGLDDETYSSLYYVYAALYTLPYLTNGLQLNSFVLLSIAAGIAHVQIERLALTEPVEVEFPETAGWLARQGSNLLRGLLSSGLEVSERVSDKAERAQQASTARPDRKELAEKSAEARAELRYFDRKAQDAESRKRPVPESLRRAKDRSDPRPK